MALSLLSVMDEIVDIADRYAATMSQSSDSDSIELDGVPSTVNLIVNGNGNLYFEMIVEGRTVPVNLSSTIQNKLFSLPSFAGYSKSQKELKDKDGVITGYRTQIPLAKGVKITSVPTVGTQLKKKSSTDGSILTLEKKGESTKNTIGFTGTSIF